MAEQAKAQLDDVDQVTIVALVEKRERLAAEITRLNAVIQAHIERMAQEREIADAGHGYELWQEHDGAIYVRAKAGEENDG